MDELHRATNSHIDGVASLDLASGALCARFVPEAGMVCASLKHRGEELLGLREGLATYRRSGATFGIPLLHPWANRLDRAGLRWGGVEATWPSPAPGIARDAQGLPIHGAVWGAADWEVHVFEAEGECARLRAGLDFTGDASRRSIFPFPHTLEVEAEIRGPTLRIATTVRATGDRGVPIAFGWHPYLRLPGVPRPQWEVTLPVGRRWRLDSGCLPTGEQVPCRIEPGALGERTYDDLFDEVAPGQPFVVEGGGRRIEQRHGPGYDYAVVYAPATDDVICFEPMTAPTNPFAGGSSLRTVAPGGAFRAEFSLTVTAVPVASR